MSDKFKQQQQQLRSKLIATSAKLDRVSNGTAMGSEEAQLPNEISQLEQEIKNLQARYQELLPSFNDGEAAGIDQTQTYLRDQMNKITRQYKANMSKNYQNFDSQQVTAEEATLENIQKMKEQKDEQINQLTKDVKVIKKVNVAIKEELQKGDEVMSDLQNGIQTANTGVKAVNAKTQAFRGYLKRNKAPMPLAIICLIITIVVWSSQGFCKFGLVVNCKP